MAIKWKRGFADGEIVSADSRFTISRVYDVFYGTTYTSFRLYEGHTRRGRKQRQRECKALAEKIVDGTATERELAE